MTYQELISMFDDKPETAHPVLKLILQKTGMSEQEILHVKTGILSLQTNQIAQIKEYIAKYLLGHPIQYVLGQAYFRGIPYTVNPSVLIPRPETEELIDLVVNDQKHYSIKNILDIGTGSGNIAISLKKEFPEATVCAMDISPEALSVAKLNAIQNEVKIEFIEGDILSEDTKSDVLFDIIVSNPPYIPQFRKDSMSPSVYEYEPSIALFVDRDDPLIFYKKILDFASKYLHKNGAVYFEISQYEYLESYEHWDIQIFKDISGNKRFLYARLNQ